MLLTNLKVHGIIIIVRKVRTSFEEGVKYMLKNYNYSKLKGRIIEKYGSQSGFASVLGVTQSTLSQKLNGHYNFSQDEINVISKHLEIEKEEIGTYFFTNKVRKVR